MFTTVVRGFDRLLQSIAPNRFAGWTIVGATAIESLLLTFVPGNIFECQGPTMLQVPLDLFAFWYVTVWSAWWFASRLSHSTAKLPVLKTAVSALIYVAALSLLLLHSAGWAMYFSTGQFGSIDALEFMVMNSGETWMVEYLWQSERWYVVAGLAATAATAALLPRFVRGIRDGRWSEAAPTSSWRTRLLRFGVFAVLVVAWAAVGKIRSADSSSTRQAKWSDAVQRRLNPAVSLALSALRRAVEEPIEPTLDERRLKPLGKDSIPSGAFASPDAPPPSVVILAIESLRHDVVHLRHQGREVMPHLNRLATAGVQFTRAYTQSTHSDYADVCIASSLYPLRSTVHHYYSQNDPWPKTLIYDVLKPAGHATAIISSQNEKWGAMDQFLSTPNLDLYFDAERSNGPTRVDRRDIGFAKEVATGALRGGALDDSYTMDRAIEWIAAQQQAGQRFNLNMNFHGSHFPYEIAPECERPFQPCEMNFEASFTYFPPEKTPIVKNAYFNALHEADKQLGRLVEALRLSGALNDTVLVIMGENGEAFHENNSICHAAEPMEPALRVALVMHAPRFLTPKIEDYPTQLIDVVPTILGLWGQPKHPNFQGINALADDRPPLEYRTLFFHVENPLARCDALLHQGRWKLIHDRHRLVAGLFDLQNDPGEQRNLVQEQRALAVRLSTTLSEWRSRQLAYYRYPQYYLRFYPPPAPEVPQ